MFKAGILLSSNVGVVVTQTTTPHTTPFLAPAKVKNIIFYFFNIYEELRNILIQL
jgi:hypothetical protein